jgi:ankyrin repeat protein
LVFTEKIMNYTKDDIHKLREHINALEPEAKSLFSKFNTKPLGAIATRLNVHGTFHTMLCQITEEALASEVKARICSKTDVNMQNTLGSTALHIAAENGHAKAVDLLIQHNADVHTTVYETKFSCLHCAALGGNGEVLESLIKEGAPLDARDNDARTMLHVAAQQGNSSVPDILSKYDSTLLEAKDNSGSTPLHTAALAGHASFVKALLKAGVDVNVQDNSGRSPLALSKQGTIKTILRSLGAGGWTPLMIAAEQGGRKFEQLLKAIGCLRCVQDKKEFPGWFQRLVCFHSALTELPLESGWVWGGHEHRNLVISDKKLKIIKETDYPDYSAAVGSKILEYGIHKWEIKVDKVSSMWMGIARGIEENDLLGSYPGNAQYHDDVFMLAFQSSGNLINCGKQVTVEVAYEQGYSSGQVIAFEIDTFRHTLSVKIDGKSVFLASGIDDRNVRPYICMDYYETAFLVSRHSLVVGDAEHRQSDTSAVETAWIWEPDPTLGTVDGAGQFARKRAAESTPVSVLGNKKLSPDKVFTWALQVKNVQEMWIGVAKGDSDRLRHISPNECGGGDQILAISAGGVFFNNLSSGNDRELSRRDSGSLFSSGHVVEVVVNVAEKWLKVRVEGALVRIVSGVDLIDFQPYVCICRSETVMFLSAACREIRFTRENASWRWGSHEQQNLRLSGPGEETITKSTDSPDYSSVIGSEELEGDIQTWSMKVENVKSMWVGIARNVEENKALDKHPSNLSGEDAYLVAFGSDGTTVIAGASPLIDSPSGYDFNSGQIVRLELDSLKNCLRMYIDGAVAPAVTASNVDCRGLRPYVCMDYAESVTLVEKTCLYRTTRAQAIAVDDWCKGFNNEIWPDEINEALIKHPLGGPPCLFPSFIALLHTDCIAHKFISFHIQALD